MRHMGREFSLKSTATNTAAPGRVTCATAQDNSTTRMAASTRASGKMTSSMVKGGRSGRGRRNSKGIMRMERNLDMVNIRGKMGVFLKVSG